MSSIPIDPTLVAYAGIHASSSSSSSSSSSTTSTTTTISNSSPSSTSSSSNPHLLPMSILHSTPFHSSHAPLHPSPSHGPQHHKAMPPTSSLESSTSTTPVTRRSKRGAPISTDNPSSTARKDASSSSSSSSSSFSARPKRQRTSTSIPSSSSSSSSSRKEKAESLISTDDDEDEESDSEDDEDELSNLLPHSARTGMAMAASTSAAPTSSTRAHSLIAGGPHAHSSISANTGSQNSHDVDRIPGDAHVIRESLTIIYMNKDSKKRYLIEAKGLPVFCLKSGRTDTAQSIVAATHSAMTSPIDPNVTSFTAILLPDHSSSSTSNNSHSDPLPPTTSPTEAPSSSSASAAAPPPAVSDISYVDPHTQSGCAHVVRREDVIRALRLEGMHFNPAFVWMNIAQEEAGESEIWYNMANQDLLPVCSFDNVVLGRGCSVTLTLDMLDSFQETALSLLADIIQSTSVSGGSSKRKKVKPAGSIGEMLDRLAEYHKVHSKVKSKNEACAQIGFSKGTINSYTGKLKMAQEYGIDLQKFRNLTYKDLKRLIRMGGVQNQNRSISSNEATPPIVGADINRDSITASSMKSPAVPQDPDVPDNEPMVRAVLSSLATTHSNPSTAPSSGSISGNGSGGGGGGPSGEERNSISKVRTKVPPSSISIPSISSSSLPPSSKIAAMGHVTSSSSSPETPNTGYGMMLSTPYTQNVHAGYHSHSSAPAPHPSHLVSSNYMSHNPHYQASSLHGSGMATDPHAHYLNRFPASPPPPLAPSASSQYGSGGMGYPLHYQLSPYSGNPVMSATHPPVPASWHHQFSGTSMYSSSPSSIPMIDPSHVSSTSNLGSAPQQQSNPHR